MGESMESTSKDRYSFEFRCSGCVANVNVRVDFRCLEDGTQLKCPVCGLINIINIGGMKEDSEDS